MFQTQNMKNQYWVKLLGMFSVLLGSVMVTDVDFLCGAAERGLCPRGS